ncbi:hypothetical protein NPIL_420751 [Nephila pilipes]|uniref:Uncharacterized protein n=1 Tax=Nephila pilipes TaxID=299642 RepID=A0A8X6QG42_NEPPI|nr:hypothetical protein NPIL_420751 [Nephila pilipes]
MKSCTQEKEILQEVQAGKKPLLVPAAEYGSTPSIAKNLAIAGGELPVSIVVCCHRGRIQERRKKQSVGPMNEEETKHSLREGENGESDLPLFR